MRHRALVWTIVFWTGVGLGSEAFGARVLETRPMNTPASLALHPEVLGSVVSGAIEWVDDWQVRETPISADFPATHVTAGPDGTLYFSAQFWFGERRRGESHVRFRRDVPATRAAVVDPSGAVCAAGYDALLIFEGGVHGTRTEVELPYEIWAADSIAVNERGDVALGRATTNAWNFAIVEDPRGEARVHAFPPESGLPADSPVRALAVDRAGHFVIATDAGLFVAVGELPGLKFAEIGAEEGLGGYWITSLANDGQGGVAIGTRKGLFLWNGSLATPAFERLTAADGLYHDWVTSVAADGAGELATGHPLGLSLVALPEPGAAPLAGAALAALLALRRGRKESVGLPG